MLSFWWRKLHGMINLFKKEKLSFIGLTFASAFVRIFNGFAFHNKETKLGKLLLDRRLYNVVTLISMKYSVKVGPNFYLWIPVELGTILCMKLNGSFCTKQLTKLSLDRQRCHAKVFCPPGVNFTNISRAAFAQIFLRQKSTALECKYKKKLCSKFWNKKNWMQNVGEIDS